MTTNKAKGTQHESLIRDTFNEFSEGYIRLYRPAQAGAKDTGDLHGGDPFTIQAKNWRDITSALNVGLKGAVDQARNNGTDYGVAVIKRPGKSVGESYAVMRWEDFARVMIRLKDAEDLLDRTEADIHADTTRLINEKKYPTRKAQP